jgi:hypothetical protein
MMNKSARLLLPLIIFTFLISLQLSAQEAADQLSSNLFVTNNQFKLKHPSFTRLAGYDVPAVKTEDFNNDGINDVAVVLPGFAKIAVQLGDGQGSLSAPTYFDTPDNPTDFDIADFNNDGEFDIITTNTAPGLISLLLGDGTGNFAFHSSFFVNASVRFLTVGKFNQDEFPDIAVVDSNTIRVFFGTGTTNFVAGGQTTIPLNSRRMIKADFDNNGKTDLVIHFAEGSASSTRIYKSNTDGTFTNPATIPTIEINGFAAGDFNNDGFSDLVITDWRQTSFKFYPGNGTGALGAPVSSPVGYFWTITSGDFNKDGNLDISSDNGSILLGNGQGSFSLLWRSAVNGSSSAAVADFNSDSFPDVVSIAGVGNPSDATVITINDGTGKPIVAASADVSGNRNFKIESADFNLDGKPDLVTADAEGKRVFVLLQDNNGLFNSTSPSGLPFGGGSGTNQGPFTVAVGDFNEDGKPDIASPSPFDNQMVIFLGSGTGTFTRSAVNFAAGVSKPYSMQIGDFNNDGHQDLVTMNYDSFNFSIFLGNGSGGFTIFTRQSVANQSGPNFVVVGDFNSDGKQDLIVSRYFQNNLLLLAGNGDGTFTTSPNQIAIPVNTSAMKTTDLNGDGKLDLAVITDEIQSSLRIGFGNGDGTFSGFTVYPLAVPAMHDILFDDYNVDGFKDLLIGDATYGNSGLILFKGNGTGAFSVQPMVPIGTSPYALVGKDFNNDGKPDVATASSTFGGTRIFLNDTNLLPELSVGDITVPEANMGDSTNAVFTVSLSQPSSQTVTVNYLAVNRTAQTPSDFTAASGQITFLPGTTSQTVILQVKGDNLDENDETFVLALNNAANATIIDGVGVGTITDDDAPPEFSAQNGSLIEGNGASFTVDLSTNLSTISGRKVKVQYSTANGTATFPSDYAQTSGILYFAPGETSKTIHVQTNPDTLVEPDETFTVNFINLSGSVINNNQSTVTIVNDDIGGNVQFSTPTYSVTENTPTATITITRQNGNASGIVVQYETSNGTAVAGQDYAAVTGSVTFGANETSKTFTVPIINDTLDETQTETVNLSITNVAGGATLGSQSTAILNIEDDDPLPLLNIGNISIIEGNQGNTNLSIPVILSAASGRDVSVSFATANITAIAPDDYISTSSVITFAPGETVKSIVIPIVGDRLVESNETFQISLMNPVNSILNSNVSIVTITNDDLSRNRLDFDGDSKTDISIFRPSDGSWWYSRSSDTQFRVFNFGVSTDKLVPGDFTGDGKTDIAIWRPSTGEWFIQRSDDNTYFSFPFGSSGDIPVVGDFDADGKADPAVFRPSSSTWYISKSSGGTIIINFGASGDLPVAADYDGDGKTDIAIFRPSDGSWWYVRSIDSQFRVFSFGVSTDKPVQGDYTGDGKADIAVFRPATGEWFIQRSEDNSYFSFPFGAAGDLPVPGDYDGDGKMDAGVFRPSNVTWFINRTTAGILITNFGATGDQPIPNVFVP